MPKKITVKDIKTGDHLAITEIFPTGFSLHTGNVAEYSYFEHHYVDTAIVRFKDGRKFILNDENFEITRLSPSESVKISFETQKSTPIIPNQTTIEEQLADQ